MRGDAAGGRAQEYLVMVRNVEARGSCQTLENQPGWSPSRLRHHTCEGKTCHRGRDRV